MLVGNTDNYYFGKGDEEGPELNEDADKYYYDAEEDKYEDLMMTPADPIFEEDLDILEKELTN